jgi:hypothetical protein
MKLVELEINSLKLEVGGCYSTSANEGSAAHGMGAGETRCGFSGRFQASPWPSVAPRPRYTPLLRVALLLISFSYINDRRHYRFPFFATTADEFTHR